MKKNDLKQQEKVDPWFSVELVQYVVSDEDGFPFESGSPEDFLLMYSQGVFFLTLSPLDPGLAHLESNLHSNFHSWPTIESIVIKKKGYC